MKFFRSSNKTNLKPECSSIDARLLSHKKPRPESWTSEKSLPDLLDQGYPDAGIEAGNSCFCGDHESRVKESLNIPWK
jgi:hypothetical protein